MTEVLQANVFFLLTGIAVIVFTVLLSVALYHLIKILKLVRSIIERVEAGSGMIAEDLSAARDYFRRGSFLSQLMTIFMSATGFGKSGGRKKKRNTKSDGAEIDVTSDD